MRDTLLEAAKLHRFAELTCSTVGAASLSERVTGSKPGSSHLTFADDLPVTDEMQRSLQRWVDVWKRRVQEQSPALPSQDKTSSARKAQTRAILGERGMDPTAVAFIYGVSTEAVKKLRGRNGFDPDTGLRDSELRQERIDGKASKQAPLTAPARAAMDDLESRDKGGDSGEAI